MSFAPTSMAGPLCTPQHFGFHEALSILKTKTRRKVDNPLTWEQYLKAAHSLTIWFMGMSDVLPEIGLMTERTINAFVKLPSAMASTTRMRCKS